MARLRYGGYKNVARVRNNIQFALAYGDAGDKKATLVSKGLNVGKTLVGNPCRSRNRVAGEIYSSARIIMQRGHGERRCITQVELYSFSPRPLKGGGTGEAKG